eukprot:10630741-Karenia_brevis.AAC.1
MRSQSSSSSSSLSGTDTVIPSETDVEMREEPVQREIVTHGEEPKISPPRTVMGVAPVGHLAT